MNSIVAQFIGAMREQGINPVEPIADKLAAGEPVRFRADGDKPGRRNGWAWLHLDGVPAGVFRHYRLGVRTVWRSGSDLRSLSSAERRAIIAEVRESDARRKAETRAKQEAVAGVARDIWRAASKADPAHGYLERKCLPAFGIRQEGDALVVPMVDCGFRLWNVQRIYPDSRKLFLPGGRTDGLFWPQGALSQDGSPSTGPLVIGEGFATMAAVHHATRHGVVAASRWLLRGEVTAIIAPGGTGKSTITNTTAISLTSGRELLGQTLPCGPQAVWIYNLEDGTEELERQLSAACKYHGITSAECQDRLHLDSGLVQPLCTATEVRDGFILAEEVFAQLTATIRDRDISVVIVDPFVSSHAVRENSNEAIDAIAKRWKRLAQETGCAVVLVHHTKKLSGREVTAEDGRGAVALRDAARIVLTLNPMSQTEADECGVTDPALRRSARSMSRRLRE